MNLLDHLDPEQRLTFEQVARRISYASGEYLVRRGDAGSDLFVIEEGTFEAIDRRRGPDVVFSTLGPGAMVGEVAFLDGAPRSADVRAASDGVVLRWDRDDLQALLDAAPAIAARFHEYVARLLVERVRNLTESTVGALSGAGDGLGEADVAAVDQVAARLKRSLAALETALRESPDDVETNQAVHEMLDHLQHSVSSLFAALSEPAVAHQAAQILQRELHPYLVRAAVAELALRRTPGVVGTAELLDYLVDAEPTGEGYLGRLIDAWLLERPTVRALRQLRDVVASTVRATVPATGRCRLLFVNAASRQIIGQALANLAPGGAHTEATVLGQSKETLSRVTWPDPPEGYALHKEQENLVAFATGRAVPVLPQQDVVVVHSMVEYLPEPLAVSLLRTCHRLLKPTGAVVLVTIGAADDQVLLDRLLGWPMIRRSPQAIDEMLTAAGYGATEVVQTEAPAQVRVVGAQGPVASYGTSE